MNQKTSFKSLSASGLMLFAMLSMSAFASDSLDEIFTESAAFVSAEAPPPDSVVISLPDAIDRALATNGRLLAAMARVDERQAQHEQAHAARRPIISSQLRGAYLGGLSQDGVETTPLSRLVFDEDDLELGDTILSGTLALQQVFYAGGSIRAAIEASEFLAASESWRESAARNDLVLEVKRAYYDCLLSRALVRVARESAETFEQHLADTEAALEVGAISRFEQLRAETELSARRTDLDAARTLQQIARMNLMRLVHWDEAAPLACDPALPLTAESYGALDELASQAIAVRPETQALAAAHLAALKQVDARKGQYKPQIGGLVQYQHIEGGGGLLPSGLIVSVGLEWELYTGGKRKHEVLEADAQARALEHEIEEVRRAIDLEVRQASVRMEQAKRKIVAAHATAGLAAEGLDLAELRFQQGAGAQTETLDADLALVQARSALVQALRDYLTARAELDKAIGEPAMR